MDVDEFRLPAGGSLHDRQQWRNPEAEGITVPRHNLALVPERPLAPPEFS